MHFGRGSGSRSTKDLERAVRRPEREPSMGHVPQGAVDQSRCPVVASASFTDGSFKRAVRLAAGRFAEERQWFEFRFVHGTVGLEKAAAGLVGTRNGW